mgnify:CR=1 FL=1
MAYKSLTMNTGLSLPLKAKWLLYPSIFLFLQSFLISCVDFYREISSHLYPSMLLLLAFPSSPGLSPQISSLIWSNHEVLFRPLGFIPFNFIWSILLDHLPSSMRILCPQHYSLVFYMSLLVSSTFNSSLITVILISSLLVFPKTLLNTMWTSEENSRQPELGANKHTSSNYG